MRTITKAAVATAIAASTFVAPAAAFAAPGDNGNGVGGCIDGLYGNATNPRPSGHGVLPSESPGPWVNSTGEFGTTVGDVNAFLRDNSNLGYQSTGQICHAGYVFP